MPLTSLQRSSQALFESAQRAQLSPHWLSDYGLMEVTFAGGKKLLFANKSELNSQLAAYLSANKHATRTVLHQYDLPNIPYCTPKTLAELESFFVQYQPVVMKPTMGQRAVGVELIKESESLPRTSFSGQIFEQYIRGKELRYLVLQSQVIAVHEKVFAGEIYQPSASQRVSYPQSSWDDQLVRTAVQACQVLGLEFAAVDFMIKTDGVALILEVNSAPALWRFESPDQGPAIAVCDLLLRATLLHWEEHLK